MEITCSYLASIEDTDGEPDVENIVDMPPRRRSGKGAATFRISPMPDTPGPGFWLGEAVTSGGSVGYGQREVHADQPAFLGRLDLRNDLQAHRQSRRREDHCGDDE
jgi:hypothetical protein